MLHVGDPAPELVLPDADMEVFDLQALRGERNVVLYFYPRDNTPGCTRQAIDFSDHVEDFERHDCSVVGVSPDDCLTHAEFRDLHGLSVRLLSDEDIDICRRYGVWESRTVDGTVRTGVTRTSFIIDKQGVIRHIFRNVAPRDHVTEVLQTLSKL
ncbi:MAG: peroxiredoxin [Zoogloeaceae bacterium]|nr:peroxiredoxin [Zoogloeaceae bacterium]